MNPRIIHCLAGAVCACAAFGVSAQAALGQTFRYEPKAKVDLSGPSYASPDPAPRMMRPSESLALRSSRPERGYLSGRSRGGMAERVRYDSVSPGYSSRPDRGGPHLASEPIPPGRQVSPYAEELPDGGPTGEIIEGEPHSGERFGGESFEGQRYEGEYSEGEPFDGDPWGEGPCRGCGGCDECGPCYIDLIHSFCACLHQTYLFSPAMRRNFNLYTGKQGFKNPVDQGVNGDFGYSGGLNWASPFWHKFGIGYQLGGAIVASDFEGRSGPLQHRRAQYFVTTGLYRRVQCEQGLQGGAVFDYLHDDFYVQMDLMQVRGELSYVYRAHELGFWFAAHTNSDTKITPDSLDQGPVTWQANDQYNLFYRYQFCNGATARSWAGLSSHGDGIFGGEAIVGFSPRWALQTSYNYLLPRNDPSVPDNVKESWNLSINLVWYPGYKGSRDWFNPYRPLFNVADNGWFMETVK